MIKFKNCNIQSAEINCKFSYLNIFIKMLIDEHTDYNISCFYYYSNKEENDKIFYKILNTLLKNNIKIKNSLYDFEYSNDCFASLKDMLSNMDKILNFTSNSLNKYYKVTYGKDGKSGTDYRRIKEVGCNHVCGVGESIFNGHHYDNVTYYHDYINFGKKRIQDVFDIQEISKKDFKAAAKSKK